MSKDHMRETQSDTSVTGSSSFEVRKRDEKKWDNEIKRLRTPGHVNGEFGPLHNHWERMGNGFYRAASKLTWSGWVYFLGFQLVWKTPWSEPYFSERNGYEKPFFRFKSWRFFFYNHRPKYKGSSLRHTPPIRD